MKIEAIIVRRLGQETTKLADVIIDPEPKVSMCSIMQDATIALSARDDMAFRALVSRLQTDMYAAREKWQIFDVQHFCACEANEITMELTRP